VWRRAALFSAQVTGVRKGHMHTNAADAADTHSSAEHHDGTLLEAFSIELAQSHWSNGVSGRGFSAIRAADEHANVGHTGDAAEWTMWTTQHALHASATPHTSGLCRFAARQTRLALASCCCLLLSSTAVAVVDCLPLFAVSHVSSLHLIAALCFMLLQDLFALAALSRALLCHCRACCWCFCPLCFLRLITASSTAIASVLQATLSLPHSHQKHNHAPHMHSHAPCLFARFIRLQLCSTTHALPSFV